MVQCFFVVFFLNHCVNVSVNSIPTVFLLHMSIPPNPNYNLFFIIIIKSELKGSCNLILLIKVILFFRPGFASFFFLLSNRDLLFGGSNLRHAILMGRWSHAALLHRCAVARAFLKAEGLPIQPPRDRGMVSGLTVLSYSLFSQSVTTTSAPSCLLPQFPPVGARPSNLAPPPRCNPSACSSCCVLFYFIRIRSRCPRHTWSPILAFGLCLCKFSFWWVPFDQERFLKTSEVAFCTDRV